MSVGMCRGKYLQWKRFLWFMFQSNSLIFNYTYFMYNTLKSKEWVIWRQINLSKNMTLSLLRNRLCNMFIWATKKTILDSEKGKLSSIIIIIIIVLLILFVFLPFLKYFFFSNHSFFFQCSHCKKILLCLQQCLCAWMNENDDGSVLYTLKFNKRKKRTVWKKGSPDCDVNLPVGIASIFHCERRFLPFK